MMRKSDGAWLALAAGVTAYDLLAIDDEQLSKATRRYFKAQPVATASIVLLTGLHLLGGIPPWCDPFTLSFAAYRRLIPLRLWPHEEAPRAAVGGWDGRSQLAA
jgi:hypothetical protein